MIFVYLAAGILALLGLFGLLLLGRAALAWAFQKHVESEEE